MRTALSVLGVLLAALAAGPAGADGGFFFREAEVGASADQMAVLVYDPDTSSETMLLRTEQEWKDPTRRTDYAWVVPVPTLVRQADFATLPEGNAAFRQLHALTEPRALIDSTGGCMNGCGSGGDTSAPGTTKVMDSFQVDDYQIQILSAADSRNLQQWLQQNSYRMPAGSEPILQSYIDRSWYFVAVKVSMPQTASDSEQGAARELDPLQIRFTTEKLVFPLRISAASSSALQRTEVLLYVLAPYRVQCDTFPTLQMTPVTGTFSSLRAFQRQYEQEFQSRLAQANGRAFITEYAGSLSPDALSYQLGALNPLLKPEQSYFLTRLRTELAAGKMDADVEFSRAPDNASFAAVGRIHPGTPNSAPLLFLGMTYSLAVVYALQRRRRGTWLRACLAVTLLALLLL